MEIRPVAPQDCQALAELLGKVETFTQPEVACALELSRRGAAVTLVDRDEEGGREQRDVRPRHGDLPGGTSTPPSYGQGLPVNPRPSRRLREAPCRC
mgnify:CR=1 FL=1